VKGRQRIQQFPITHDAPKHLTRLAEAAPHEAHEVGHVGHVELICRPRPDGQHERLDLRTRPKHRRWEDRDQLRVRQALADDRDRTVGRGPGFGHQPFPDFLLNRASKPLERGRRVKRFQQQRNGDLVGQVGNQLACPARPGLLRVQDVKHEWVNLVLARQDIGLHQREARLLAETVAQQRLQTAIDFDGNDASPAFEQDLGQRAGARAHLEDNVVRPYLCRLHQLTHQVKVNQEVLPVALPGRQTGPRQQGADIRQRLAGHDNDGAASRSNEQGDWLEPATAPSAAA